MTTPPLAPNQYPAPFVPPPVPQGPAAQFDFFQAGSPYFVSRPPAGRNSFRAYSIPGFNQILRWELWIEDLSGGLDLMQTRIDAGFVSNKLADSTLWHRDRRSLTLAPLVTTQTGITPSGNFGMFSCLAFDDIAIGLGSGANVSLLSRTSNTNGALAAHTFTPNGVIYWLHAGHIGGVATDERLFVLGTGAGEVLSDLSSTPTSAGDMHANTADCWWWYESPFNSTTPGAGMNIFQAANNIYTLSTTAAIGDAPTSRQTQIRDGGFGIGKLTISGAPPRIYFVQPRVDNTSSMLTAAGVVGDIFSIDLEGDDLQQFDGCSLPFVKFAAKWRNGMVYTDQKSVMFFNGAEHNLSWMRERLITTNRQPRVQGFIVINEELMIVVQDQDVTDSGASAKLWWVEQYIPEDDSWFQITPDKSPSNGTSDIEPTAGSFPVWRDTDTGFYDDNFVYLFEDANNSFDRFALTPPAWNPYYIYRNTDGSSGFEQLFATTGTSRLPIYHFFPGFPKCVSDITFMGEFLGEDSKVEIEVASQGDSTMSFSGNQSAFFNEDDPWMSLFWKNPAPELFDKLQLQITLTQGTSGTGVTRTTPQGLPFMVGGYIYLDGQYKDPSSLEPWRFSWR